MQIICSVIAFHKYIQVFITGRNTVVHMTGRAYMGEVLTQVLKSIKK